MKHHSITQGWVTWLKMQISPGPADLPVFSMWLSMHGSMMFFCLHGSCSSAYRDVGMLLSPPHSSGQWALPDMLQPHQDVSVYALGMGGSGWHLT